MTEPTQSSTPVVDGTRRTGAGSGVLAELRHRTITAHRALEARLDLLAADLSVERYADVLERFAAVHLTLDEAIAGWLDTRAEDPSVVALQPDRRRRMPWLRADLRALGRPLPSAVPFRLRSFGEALGAMYVTEGSTLGGRVIVAHVRDVLGADVPTGYFASYGEQTMSMWSSFRRRLPELVLSDEDLLAARTGAVRTFDLVAEHVAP